MITPLYKDVYNIIKEAFDFSSAIDDNDELIITLDKKDIIPYINDRLQQLFPEKNDEKTICLITHTELIDYNFITINGSIYIIYTCWHSTDEELNTMPYINDVEQTYFIKYADNEFQQPCPLKPLYKKLFQEAAELVNDPLAIWDETGYYDYLLLSWLSDNYIELHIHNYKTKKLAKLYFLKIK